MKNKDLKRMTKEAVCMFLKEDMGDRALHYFNTIAKDEGIDQDATNAAIEDAIAEFVSDIKEHFDIWED